MCEIIRRWIQQANLSDQPCAKRNFKSERFPGEPTDRYRGTHLELRVVDRPRGVEGRRQFLVEELADDVEDVALGKLGVRWLVRVELDLALRVV